MQDKIRYNKYSEYKDSGVDWLGEIPRDWDLYRLGALLSPISEKNRPNFPLLSITREKGVIKRDIENEDENHNFIPDDLSNYKVLRVDQFGMNKMKAWQGSYGVSRFNGIVSPAYYTFTLSSKLNSRFFHIAIRSKAYVAKFGAASDGVRIGQWDLSKDRMSKILFVTPSISEQIAIASFLDDKTTKIDKAISNKQKLIKLLKERKQIIIQDLVTGKKVWDEQSQSWIKPTKTKNSGVEWIGEIPEEWEVKPGMSYLKENKRNNKGMKENVVLSLSYGNIIIKPKEKLVGLVPESFETYQIVYPNDIIVRCTDLQNDQTSLRTGLSKEKGIITSAYLNLGIKDNHLPEYIHAYLHFIDTTKVIYKYGSGLRQNLNFPDFKRMPFLDLTSNEQFKIVDYINLISKRIIDSISIQERQIEKLKEYKSVLIDSAVTGKIRVC